MFVNSNPSSLRGFFDKEENRYKTAFALIIAIIGTVFALNIAATASALSSTFLGSVNVTFFSPLLIVGLLLVAKNTCGASTAAGKTGSFAILAFAMSVMIPNIIMLSDFTILSAQITGGITTAMMTIGGSVLAYNKFKQFRKNGY